MNETPPILDYLIIGQGLAGSLLARQLLRRGRRLLVVDDGHHSSSSTVAAGLINPLAGLRYSLPPRIDEWMASLERTYAELGEQFGTRFHHPIDMVRLFRSNEQVRFWERRAADPHAAPYLAERFSANHSGQPVKAPFGGFHQHRTGYVNLPALLAAIKQSLIDQGCYREAVVTHDEIEPNDTGVRWRDIGARRLVFCDGYRAMQGQWFGWLPFTPTKGEFLKLESDSQGPDRIVNSAHILVPLAEGGYRFGATHDRRRFDNEPTPEGLEELLQGLAAMLTQPEAYRVTEQHAGVRPATQDKHPYLGQHPEHPALCLFNGFGAKGTLEIPWHAERLAAWLEGEEKELPAECDIARHRELCNTE